MALNLKGAAKKLGRSFLDAPANLVGDAKRALTTLGEFGGEMLETNYQKGRAAQADVSLSNKLGMKGAMGKLSPEQEGHKVISKANVNAAKTKAKGLAMMGLMGATTKAVGSGAKAAGKAAKAAGNALKMTPYRATGLAEGFEEPITDNPEEEIRAAWQYLHDTGLAYRLQGWFGRTAQSLIEQGFIHE